MVASTGVSVNRNVITATKNVEKIWLKKPEILAILP
jgi:hypothetical protein